MTDDQELAQLNSNTGTLPLLTDEQELNILNGVQPVIPSAKEQPERAKTMQTLMDMPAEIPSGRNIRHIKPTTKWQYDVNSTWNFIKNDIPAEYHKKAKNALTLAATHDIAPSEAFRLHDNFIEGYKKKYKESYGDASLWDKAQGSIKAGMGDVYATFGNSLKWAGTDKDFADVYVDYGNRLRLAYIPPEDPSEFTYDKILSPDWWATSVTRSVPFTLSLVPAAIVGAYGGAALAGVVGLGAFGTTILGAIGGAALSRPVESAFEAGGVYEAALQKGMTEDEAKEAATTVFKGNLTLVGLDAAQFALAFTPLKFGGPAAKQVLAQRILATTGKFAAVGGSEAFEERYQEFITAKAVGEKVNFFDLNDPRLNEASTIGGIFGIGLSGVGSVWTALTNEVTKDMPDSVRDTYETAYSGVIETGAESHIAEVAALDAVAATPEGKAHIEDVVSDLKDRAEGKKIEKEITPEPIEEAAPVSEAEISKIEPTEETETDAMLDLITEGRDIETLTDEELDNRLIQQTEPAEAPADLRIENIPEKLEIEVMAMKAKTGEKIKIKGNAREAFTENQNSLKKYQSLLDCLGV